MFYINKERRGGAGGARSVRLPASPSCSGVDIERQLTVVDPAIHDAERRALADEDLAMLFRLVLADRAFDGLVAGPDLELAIPELVGLAVLAGALELPRILDREDHAGDADAVVQRVQEVRKVCPSLCNLTAASIPSRLRSNSCCTFHVLSIFEVMTKAGIA